ncbi:glycosyltransferase family 2 protein [candidate division KSB1 bacterium]|nr:glycosyltransferase family 2 protein [candidate division KSB1 bacterium]RQW00858.1 MAG: glycosyltransferase family 2 protein [candidate division KSB1 bacterium]
MLSNVLIAIPAYNEERFIGGLLQEISAIVPHDHILVVNDGSTDRTREIVRSFNVRTIDHHINRGKGEAIKAAFSFARAAEYDWILFLDGDGQHPVRFLGDFFEKIQRNNSDVLLGDRRSRKESMPLHRQLSNGFSSVLVSLCAGGQRVRDSQCGFRAIRLDKMRKIQCRSTGFQVESEILVKLGRAGAKFDHVPITTVYGNETSSIHIVWDTLKFIKLIVKSLWW